MGFKEYTPAGFNRYLRKHCGFRKRIDLVIENKSKGDAEAKRKLTTLELICLILGGLLSFTVDGFIGGNLRKGIVRKKKQKAHNIFYLVDFDAWDAYKMFLVECEDNKVVVQGGCANEYIKIRNNFSPPTQVGAHFSKRFHDRLIERQSLEGSEEFSKRG
jgi:hypothetical protein